MLLTKFALKKPITVAMLFIAVIIIGIFSLINLPLSLIPNLNYPKLTIQTSWFGASPQEIESKITSQVESIGSSVKGIKNIKSTSHIGYSVVNLEFSRNTDMDFARFELNEKLNLLEDKLPEDVVPKISAYIPKQVEDENFLEYGISGPYETEELKELTEKYFKYKIISTEGVSACEIRGSTKKIIKIKIKKQNVNKVNLFYIRNALSNFGELNSFNGFRQHSLSYTVKLDDSFGVISELERLKVTRRDGSKIRLNEIANIELEPEEAGTYYRFNTEPQVRMLITKANSANAIKLSNKIKSIINNQKIADNISIIKISDEAEEIEKGLNVLYKRGFISLIIIFIVLIIFLRHFTSTFLVLSTILLSSCLTFILMNFFGIGLNMLSLAGLALGFGMMVDNSIVVYENIFRNRHRGLNNYQSAIVGVSEVALPITASTLTTIIVFAPFLYITGDMKLLFIPFIISMSLSLISSLFISFTFIPFASDKLLTFKAKHVVSREEFHFDPNLNTFQKIIRFLIRFRWIWLILITGILTYSFYLFIEKVDKGYVWDFPRDDYINIYINLPVGSNINQTDKIAREFEKKIEGSPGITEINTRVYTRFANIKVEFEEATKQTADPLILREKLKAFAVNFGNSNIYIRGFGPSFGGSGATYANFSLKLKGYNYEKLKEITKDLGHFMQQTTRRIRNVNTNALNRWSTEKLYEYELIFDRKKMAKHQINIFTIQNQIYPKISSYLYRLNKKISNKEYTITVVDEKLNDFSITDLKNMLLFNNNNAAIKLAEIATIKKVEILPRIEREDELYYRTINYDYRGSYRKGNNYLDALTKTYPLPFGYSFQREENTFDTEEGREKLKWILIFSVILVYMTLAAVFESFKYPFIILLTLPLAFVGVSLIFHLTEETFTTYAQIGLILLVGIVVNNSIIMVFRINQLRKHRIKRKNAILQAVKDRLRPILMTSLTTITGLLPMLLKTETGQNDFWRLLSLSTIGGLTSSTLFVLTFIPILYYLFSGKKDFKQITNNKLE